MDSGTNPIALPTALPTEEATGYPSVVGLLSRQLPTTPDVAGLDRTDLRKRYPDIVRPLESQVHPVEGRFVRVKGDHRCRGVRLRRAQSVEQDDLPKPDVNLRHTMVRVRQEPAGGIGPGRRENTTATTEGET